MVLVNSLLLDNEKSHYLLNKYLNCYDQTISIDLFVLFHSKYSYYYLYTECLYKHVSNQIYMSTQIFM